MTPPPFVRFLSATRIAQALTDTNGLVKRYTEERFAPIRRAANAEALAQVRVGIAGLWRVWATLLTSTPTAAPTQVQARDSMLNDGRAAVEISRLKQSVHAEKSAREEAYTALLANIQRFVPEPAHKGVCDRPRNAVNSATPFTRSLF